MNSLSGGRKAVCFFLPLFFLFFLDRLFKYLADLYLFEKDPYVLIEGVLELSYTENSGAAFGMLSGFRFFFIVIGIIVIGYSFLVFMKLPPGGKFLPLSMTLVTISAGALGNLYDRILYGYVVDYIYFRLIDFPLFNFADILVTLSAAKLCFLFLFYYTDEDISKIYFPGR